MIILLSILLVVSLIFLVLMYYKIKELNEKLVSKPEIKPVNIDAIVSDLDTYRKVAKGYEVAGIKKSLKIIADHIARKE